MSTGKVNNTAVRCVTEKLCALVISTVVNTTISSFRFQLGKPLTLLQIIVPQATDSTAQLFSLAMIKLQKLCIDSIGGSILYPKSQLSQQASITRYLEICILDNGSEIMSVWGSMVSRIKSAEKHPPTYQRQWASEQPIGASLIGIVLQDF